MKVLASMVMLVVLSALSGCAGNRSTVLKAAGSTRQDVFQEYSESDSRSDRALLNIEFTIKCFKGRFINTYLKYSDPPYTVTVNIDGQSTVLSDEPVLEESISTQIHLVIGEVGIV